MLKNTSLTKKKLKTLNPSPPSRKDTCTTNQGFSLGIIKENSFILSFIFTGVAFLIILSTLPVGYETNDDFAMVTILSGKGGFPSIPDAIFLNPILSYILFFLYKVSPSFPWYGISLYLTCYLGWSLIFSVILRSNRGFCFILVAPFLFYFFFYHSTNITFTAASLYLAFGVYLCLVEYFIRDEAPIKNYQIYFICLALCFYLSFLFRWKLVLYSLLLLLPMAIFLKSSQGKKAYLGLITLISVIFLNTGYNYFVSSSHQPYNEFNELRGEFHDTFRGETHGGITPYAINKVGWNYADYLAFKGLWLIYDNHAFNTKTLKTFLKENEPQKLKANYLYQVINRLTENFNQNKTISLLLFISFCSIVLFRASHLGRLDKVDRLKISVSLGSIIISICFFMYYRYELRVFGPLGVYLLSMSLLLFNRLKPLQCDEPQNQFLKYFTLVATGALMTYVLFTVCQGVINNINLLDISFRHKIQINQAFSYIESKNPFPYPVVVEMRPTMGNGLCTEFIHPLKEYNDFPRIKVLPIGWMINSPYYYHALNNLHLHDGHDFLKWLVDRKDVFLVLYAQDPKQTHDVMLLWKAYYLRHITPDREVDFIPVFDFRNQQNTGLVLFQIKSDKY